MAEARFMTDSKDHEDSHPARSAKILYREATGGGWWRSSAFSWLRRRDGGPYWAGFIPQGNYVVRFVAYEGPKTRGMEIDLAGAKALGMRRLRGLSTMVSDFLPESIFYLGHNVICYFFHSRGMRQMLNAISVHCTRP